MASDSDDDEASAEEGSQEILKAGKELDFQKSTRLRSKADNQKDKQNELEDRKGNQMRLHKIKSRDLKLR